MIRPARRLAVWARRRRVLARFPCQATCEACGQVWTRPQVDPQESLVGFVVAHQGCRRQTVARWN